MTSRRRPEAPFDDALFGADGTAEPPPGPWAAAYFADALAEPTADATPRLVLPEVVVAPTVRELTAPFVDAPAAPPTQVRRDPRRRRDAEIAFTAAPVPQLPPPARQLPPTAQMLPVQVRSAPVRSGPVGQWPVPVRQGPASAAPPTAGFPAPWMVGQQPPPLGGHPSTPIRPQPSIDRRPQPARPSAQYPPLVARRPEPVRRRSRGGGFVAIFVVILFLVVSNAGRDILDAIAKLLHQ